jgi:hypothetical protein
MANKEKQDVGFLATLVGQAIGYLLAGVLIVLTWSLLAAFIWAKKPISRTLGLEMLSASWPRMKWFYIPVKWISMVIFLGIFIQSMKELFSTHVGIDHFIVGILYFGISLFLALVFVTFHWLEEYSADPEIQQRNAGIEAEVFVQKMIDVNMGRYPLSRSLHNVLFVFHSGTQDEYSAEVDHILITPKHIFLIETKYKSGTIRADVEAPTWQTSSHIGESSMRNALLQAKNTARLMQRELTHPADIIPLVAIYGNEVMIIGGPGNVVAAPDLMKAIHAFETTDAAGPVIDPADVVDRLLRHTSRDGAALNRHIERARAAKLRSEFDSIVRTSSIK